MAGGLYWLGAVTALAGWARRFEVPKLARLLIYPLPRSVCTILSPCCHPSCARYLPSTMRTTLAPSPPLSSQAQPRPLGAGRQLPSLPCLVRGRCAASPGLHGSHAASHPRPTLTASRAASTLGIEAYAPVKPMADDLGVVIFSEHEQGLPELINLYQ